MSISDDGPSRIVPVTPANTGTSAAQAAAALSKYAILQEASEEEFNSWADQAFNPIAIARRFETLETKAKRKDRDEETRKAERKEERIVEITRSEEASEQYQRKNPELLAKSLQALGARISKRDSKEEILRKVLETYPDFSLADEALDFLLEIADADLARVIKQAKNDLNSLYSREIRAGKNIHTQARQFSAQGLGNPTALRDLYRDITSRPRDATTLFTQLSDAFTYEKMQSVIDFLLHSLGSDLKSKGPSISSGELHRLLTETRSLQAILGIYRFFKSRMKLMNSSFQRLGLTYPARLTFEVLARQFMKFIQERYPNADKVLQLAAALGISEELAAQIIIFTQMRDALRHIAPKLFKSDQQRHDLLMAFIDTLEDLEEQLEEEEEDEDDDNKEEDKK